MTEPGLVSLAGAGPGDPGLITVKALERLKEADVIVYDRLANPALLMHAKPGAELIDAGKGRSAHRPSAGSFDKFRTRRMRISAATRLPPDANRDIGTDLRAESPPSSGQRVRCKRMRQAPGASAPIRCRL